ncbi:hypothetical protein JCM5296_004357 [Sporobolomyces johnsonii]
MATAPPPASPAFSILRIKRKRTANQLPLDALVIEQPEPSSKRRKANAHHPEPQNAVPRGIFRFAETVPLDSFSSPTKTRQVKDRIQSFLRHPPHVQASQRPLARIPSSASLRTASTASGSPSLPGSPSTPSGRKLPSSASALRSTPTHSPRASLLRQTTDARVLGVHEESRRARYRIIERQRESQERLRELREEEEVRKGLRPPRVWSALELRERDERERARKETEKGETRIYEAVQEEDEAGLLKKARKGAGKGPAATASEKEQVMMDSFGEMLKEYLTLQDSALSPSSLAPPAPIADPSPSSALDQDSSEDEDDFVYDVYYRDLREPSGGGSSKPDGAPGGSGFDVSSLEGLKRIGELSVPSPFCSLCVRAGLDDDDELLQNDDDASSEEEDNADQDSNEENDYRNDYPDEESEDSDRFDESDSVEDEEEDGADDDGAEDSEGY